MSRKRVLSSLLCFVLLFLTACTNNKTGRETKESSKPDTILEMATDSKEEILTQSKKIAECYQSIYEDATNKHTIGSLEYMQQVVACLGKAGHVAVDLYNQVDMVNAGKAESFCASVKQKKKATLTILTVTTDGGFMRYDLQAAEGKVQVSRSSLLINGKKMQATYIDQYEAYHWTYTKRGYLFFEQYHPNGYDGPSGHTAIRVASLDAKCREYNQKYIAPIGYYGNNMFITNWNEKDYKDLNFYDMYDVLYEVKNKVQVPYESEETTYEIPAKEFENVIGSFFLIDARTLRKSTVYNSKKDIYQYRHRGVEDSCLPEYPYPEVVQYVKNEDGTITLTVQGVWEWENLDNAWTSKVVIRPLAGEGVQYVSNTILSENTATPDWYTKRVTMSKE